MRQGINYTAMTILKFDMREWSPVDEPEILKHNNTANAMDGYGCKPFKGVPMYLSKTGSCMCLGADGIRTISAASSVAKRATCMQEVMAKRSCCSMDTCARLCHTFVHGNVLNC